MNKEQQLKKVKDKALALSKKALHYETLVGGILRNIMLMQTSDKYAHLRDLNALGTHLSDPVYQKLSDAGRGVNSMPDTSYIDDALRRIGNRTMTQEEYELLEKIPQEKLISYRLDERLRDLQKRLDNGKRINGRLAWLDGPFGWGSTLRNKFQKEYNHFY